MNVAYIVESPDVLSPIQNYMSYGTAEKCQQTTSIIPLNKKVPMFWFIVLSPCLYTRQWLNDQTIKMTNTIRHYLL